MGILLARSLSFSGAVSKDRRLYKRAAVKDSWTWPGGVVFYRFSKNLGKFTALFQLHSVLYSHNIMTSYCDVSWVLFLSDNAGKRRLQRAMRHIESRTCIKFRERTNEPNYVFMQYDFKDRYGI